MLSRISRSKPEAGSAAMPEAWSSDLHPLDTARILRVLEANGVRAIVVGGLACIVHGWAGSTFDADMVPASDDDNLNRLGRALQEVRAVVFADPGRRDLLAGGKPPEADLFGYTAEGLRGARVWHLTSDAGPIDITFEIDGVGGFERLEESAQTKEAFGIAFRVASLEDIVASKRAVARPKDLRALPELEDLLRERHSEPRPLGRTARGSPSGHEEDV